MEITILFIGEMEATFTAGRFQDRASSADMTSLEVTGMTGDYREYESGPGTHHLRDRTEARCSSTTVAGQQSVREALAGL